MPRLVLVCGLPGAGKTTLARRLEQSLPALRLCPDEWLDRLGFDLFDEPARARIEALMWDLARQLLHLGTNVILESGFWARIERDEKREAAREMGARVELRSLDVPFDELWQRVERRNSDPAWTAAPITRKQLRAWAATFQAPDAAELSLYDAPEPAASAKPPPGSRHAAHTVRRR